MEKTYAVITGASSGIGAAFAKLLAKEGYNLVLIARRKERLSKYAKVLTGKYGVDVKYIVADLSREEECFRVSGALEAIPIRIFINNAGFGECGSFLDTSLDKELAMTDVNVKAVQIFTKQMLKKFGKTGEGSLLNVASIAGLLPGGPRMAAYYASKAYVASFTRAVAYDLKEAGSKIYVGALCPGPVNTEFNRVAHSKFSFWGITPEKCVSYAYKQMKRGKTIIIPGLPTRIAAVCAKFAPTKVSLGVTARQQMRREYPAQDGQGE